MLVNPRILWAPPRLRRVARGGARPPFLQSGAVLAWTAFAHDAEAHAPGISRGVVRVSGERVAYVVELAAADDAALGGRAPAVALFADGVACARGGASSTSRTIDGDGVRHVETFRCQDARASVYLVELPFLEALGADHVHLAAATLDAPGDTPHAASARAAESAESGESDERGSIERGEGATMPDRIVRAADGGARWVRRDAKLVSEDRPAVFDLAREGATHVLGGADHLAFLAGLVISARRLRRLVLAVTGFTLGHSIALALSAYGLARVPQRIVEPLIALSIAVVGVVALVRLRRERDRSRGDGGATARGRPHRARVVGRSFAVDAAVPTAFGLVHGLGLAGGLAAVSVAGGARALALLAFNVGVELAQLAVVVPLGMLSLAAVGRAAHRPRSSAVAARGRELVAIALVVFGGVLTWLRVVSGEGLP
jgi:hypothetical protein